MSVPPTGSRDVVPAHPHVVAAGGVRWRDSLRTRMVLWSSVINAGLLLLTALAFYLGARARRTQITASTAGAGKLKLVVSAK